MKKKNMESGKFKIKPTIIGEQVKLRQFIDRDIATMVEILNDPDVKRLTGSVSTKAAAETPMSNSDKIKVKEWYLSRHSQADRLDLAIEVVESKEIVGEIVLNEWDQDNSSCNLRILIGPAGQNKGFGSEAISLLLKDAFERLNLHRIELAVFSFNPRARHVYQKLGFIYEGRLREAHFYEDKWLDIELFSLLDSDYHRLQAK